MPSARISQQNGKWGMDLWMCSVTPGDSAPRRREGQEIGITSNGPDTLLKDRYQHPHFTCQESRAGRGQVIDSQSQAVNGAGVQLSPPSLTMLSPTLHQPLRDVPEFRLSSARECSLAPRKPLLLSVGNFLHLSPTKDRLS